MDVKHVKLLILFLCSGYLAAEEVIVEIPDGKIKGSSVITITNNTYFSFQGIPFAAPPINELRFQAPQPLKPWDDILDATYDRNICYQVSADSLDENEDCLFINIFTPKNPLSRIDPLPVMVFIYGGGFLGGSSNIYSHGPHHFMEHDVILVTFNYRVGPFGFFSTGDDAIPGNAGLKDQNFALQWVNKNIEYFGGDPEKVTIFGESAGGASVAYHILSPKSKGLFRAAIAESGSALSPWAYQRKQVEITYQTAGYINSGANVTEMNSSELLEYLLSLPAKAIDAASDIVARTESYDYIQIQQGFFYAPVVEHEHEGAFISKKQYDILESEDINKVPLIIGFNSEESSFLRDDPNNLLANSQWFDNNPKRLVPLDLHLAEEDIIDKAAEEIKSVYTDSSFEEEPLQLIKYYSDQSFIRSIIKHAEIQSQITDVFFYRFAYSGPLGGVVQEPVEGFSDIVRHAEELLYLFVNDYGGSQDTSDLSKFPESDALVLRRFITMFTNFAKTLNPTPERDELLQNIVWPKVNPTYFPYLDIGSYSQVRLHPRNDTFTAWETIYEKYGKEPYDTY